MIASVIVCNIYICLNYHWIDIRDLYTVHRHNTIFFSCHACGTLKCENAAICEKVDKCEKNSTLNVKIDAICEKITLNVKK